MRYHRAHRRAVLAGGPGGYLPDCECHCHQQVWQPNLSAKRDQDIYMVLSNNAAIGFAALVALAALVASAHTDAAVWVTKSAREVAIALVAIYGMLQFALCVSCALRATQE